MSLSLARDLLILFAASCVCMELGFRVGRFRERSGEGPIAGVLSVALSAHLALLGFLLAFTFGLAANRLGERKMLVIDEANAIGTAGLRARALPEPHAAKIRRILADYAELRGVLIPEGRLTIAEAEPRSDALAKELWAETRLVILEGKPSEPFVSLFAASVNEVIDTGTKRATVVIRHQVPRAIWVTLGLIGALCMLMLGFAGGIQKGPRPWVALPLAVSLAVVVNLVSELDEPLGLVKLSQEPMRATLRELRSP